MACAQVRCCLLFLPLTSPDDIAVLPKYDHQALARFGGLSPAKLPSQGVSTVIDLEELNVLMRGYVMGILIIGVR